MVVIKEQRSMFWGVTLDSGKRYQQIVEKGFHISMAALEPASMKDGARKGNVTVMLAHEKAEFVLCTLNSTKYLQQPLDLNFIDGEEVTFFTNGPGHVHLTGYLLEDEDGMDELDDSFDPEHAEMSEDTMSSGDEEYETDDEDEDDSFIDDGTDEEAPELVGEDDSEEDDSDDDSLEDIVKTSGKRKITSEKKSKKRAKIESSEEENESDEDLGASFVEIIQAKKTPKKEGAKTPNKSPKKEGTKSPKKEGTKSPKKEGSKSQPTTPKTKSSPTTPQTNGESSKKKKKNKKAEDGAGDQKSKSETPTSKSKTPSKTPNEKGDNKKQSKDEKNDGATPGAKKVKKVIDGNVVSEDIKVGHGPEAKPGRVVGVYYQGKLQNGKQFDAALQGKPFKFRLGKNEVIKGWDAGVKGMKVGGKRKLTIPPKMAYASQSLPGIPPNSTLVFDVELKSVN